MTHLLASSANPRSQEAAPYRRLHRAQIAESGAILDATSELDKRAFCVSLLWVGSAFVGGYPLFDVAQLRGGEQFQRCLWGLGSLD